MWEWFGNEIWSVRALLHKKKNLLKNSIKNVAQKLVPGPFSYLKNHL